MTQFVTFLCLIPFFAFQTHYLRLWGGNYPVEYIFALAGLFVSGLALYGHLMVSLGCIKHEKLSLAEAATETVQANINIVAAFKRIFIPHTPNC